LGRLTTSDLSSIHARLNELLAEESGAHIDAFFYCPHHIGACSCRKPDIGLFLQAQERWPDIDFGTSAMVGDSANDITAGQKLGMTSIRLGVDAPDLAAAVDLLLKDTADV
jgi:D-glycero-D-manno-heptose 1,7-bisphosphate phosphatase